MASSGKKNKKVKRKAVPLNAFLSETGGPTLPAAPVRKSSNWADEVEDETDTFEPRMKHNIVLPTAPRAVAAETDERVPNQPPYVAFISNLTYDVEEEDLADFFADMKIESMRLPRDDREGGKLKGFGYIEFQDRESLINAISITETTLKGRRMRIEVATNSENDRRRGNRMESGRDRMDRPEISSGDWRSGPRAEPQTEERRGGGGFNRDRDRSDRDRNGAAESDSRSGPWRDSNNDRPAFRDDRYSSDRFSRDDRGGRFGDNRGFGPRKNFGDRDGDRDGFSKGPREDKFDKEPRARPKLVLAPRTKPLEDLPAPAPETKEAETATVPASAPVPAASIFGAAKPVDTSARERQIEERLAKEKEVLLAAPRSSSRDNSKSRVDNVPEEENKKRDVWRSRRDGSGSRERRDKYDRDTRYDRDSTKYDKDTSKYDRDSSKYDKDSSKYDKDSSKYDKDSSKYDRDSSKYDRDTSKYDRDTSKYDRDTTRDRDVARHDSPERRPSSRGPVMRRNDDRRAPPRNDRGPPRGSDKGPPARSHPDDRSDKRSYDRERNIEDKMPKLKEPEAPNFTASNKFAYLEAEGDSD